MECDADNSCSSHLTRNVLIRNPKIAVYPCPLLASFARIPFESSCFWSNTAVLMASAFPVGLRA